MASTLADSSKAANLGPPGGPAPPQPQAIIKQYLRAPLIANQETKSKEPLNMQYNTILT